MNLYLGLLSGEKYDFAHGKLIRAHEKSYQNLPVVPFQAPAQIGFSHQLHCDMFRGLRSTFLANAPAIRPGYILVKLH